MSGKNRAFADGLTAAISGVTGRQGQSRPNRSIINDRTNRLAEVASGKVVTRTHEFIDPARCKMWEGHNRDYAALSYENCRELIESIRAQGRQEVPAIVRRLTNNPDFDFEVICGARRHWSVSWLNANNYRDIKFLVEPREMEDEEAFRIADLENRAREDLTDYERAKDYLLGLDRYYHGRQKTMADRLNVSEAWLSRYLDLARLPEAVTRAFVSPHDIRLKHVMQIKPLIKDSASREVVYEAAERIAALRSKDQNYLVEPAAVARELENAVAAELGHLRRGSARSPKRGTVAITRDTDGKAIVKIDAKSPKRLQVTFMLAELRSREEMEEAVKLLTDRYWPVQE
ncbi:ParB/RepB/Spo0J family partition protein [Komagataeibacter xylinus]|uniref:ParB/RepB/Spo0J family partition protein n=1 Tax=Komagataeibacter xylinus TaxID=28448 RepID=UPI000FDF81AB|nr:ParB/RepB/Spo0J family partition protein [Komagataeibacter xylinus]AZV40445.1 replication protein B [Komagataeibacter xylinus]